MNLKKQIIVSSVIISLIIILSSCFLLRNDNSGDYDELMQKEITIQGFAQVHHPYCGGATPTPEMEHGHFSSLQNSTFYIVLKEDSSRTAIDSFKTNNKGFFEIKLIPDEYSIFEANKMIPLEMFVKANIGNGSNTFVMGQGCLKNWYNTPDFALNATQDTTIEIIFYSRCFVGTNPCLQYTGPYPP